MPHRTVVDAVRAAAQKLPPIDSPEFGPMFDSFGSARVVLIGDASHGTSEFYRARAAITQHLITHHNFTTVAIEADWPDARAVDRFVRRHPTAPRALATEPVFDHFPRWMWRNREVQAFVDWLRAHNAARPAEERTGFYGLDLYSMGASIRAVVEYLDRRDPDAAHLARERYACLQPWVDEPSRYGQWALETGDAPCEAGAVAMLRDLLRRRLQLAAEDDGEAFLDAECNARVVRGAEAYYRALYRGGAASWNLRDAHMFGTLARLLQVRGGKAVVWAHTSHVGDARSTEMGRRGEQNIGQLCRERWPGRGEVAIVGCGTHVGTVAAADGWGGRMKVKAVTPSRADSYERVLHDAGVERCLLDLRDTPENAEVRQALGKQRRERFIGVIYRPDTELWSHYATAILPKQMDAMVWFDRTEAVRAFETAQPKEDLGMDETYPFGM